MHCREGLCQRPVLEQKCPGGRRQRRWRRTTTSLLGKSRRVPLALLTTRVITQPELFSSSSHHPSALEGALFCGACYMPRRSQIPAITAGVHQSFRVPESEPYRVAKLIWQSLLALSRIALLPWRSSAQGGQQTFETIERLQREGPAFQRAMNLARSKAFKLNDALNNDAPAAYMFLTTLARQGCLLRSDT